jgi:polynucleotide 5'-kinase involved in rRNA processing
LSVVTNNTPRLEALVVLEKIDLDNEMIEIVLEKIDLDNEMIEIVLEKIDLDNEMIERNLLQTLSNYNDYFVELASGSFMHRA